MGKSSNDREAQRSERLQARKERRQASYPNHDPQDMDDLPSASLSAQPVSDVLSSIHPMGGAMDKLLRNKDTVEQFSNIVGVIAHLAHNMKKIGLEPEIDSAKRIKELDTALRESHRVTSEDMEKNKTERQRLDRDYEELDRRKHEFEQEKDQSAKMLELHKASLAQERESMEVEMKEKAKKQVEAQVAQYRRDTEDKIRKLESNNSRLNAEVSKMEACQLALEKQRRIGEMALERNLQLEEQLSEYNARLPIQSADITDLKTQFEQLYHSIQAITTTYVAKLPQEAFQSFRYAGSVSESHAVFRNIPISASPISEFLRTRAAQSLISRRICESLWKPFGSRALEGMVSSSSATLRALSDAGRLLDPKLETAWRALTYKIIDSLANTEVDLIVQRATEDISRFLERQVEPQYFQKFRDSLLTIFQDGARLWGVIRVDYMQVSISFPDDESRVGWVSHDFPDSQACPINEQGFKTLCLFPRIEVLSGNNEWAELCPGQALFSDSSALAEGAKELDNQKSYLDRLYQQMASAKPIVTSDFETGSLKE
ncbi:hypothetical protein MGYG_05051 [Nannizzia gypsea CBS 118893]|uniref:Uncharacterized protein n=1 Tax=Arthroderma gypseum (strain ATCC MYA-4604 / CBS 118893) TaxID=535722 RepID=E4UY85_ARTGP|nr:hypothetical protein MGYG_05051 [Nannizzia gypsea CBS 118893]EFR02048.1 hypothetical protein MGYG_05051 [Nannizzia gypsea CBS 118893]